MDVVFLQQALARVTVELKEANSANTNFWRQQGRNALNSQQMDSRKRSTSVCAARDNTEIAAAQAAAQTQACLVVDPFRIEQTAEHQVSLFSTASTQSNERCGRQRHHVSSERKATHPLQPPSRRSAVRSTRKAQLGFAPTVLQHAAVLLLQRRGGSKTQLTHDTRCTTRHETALVIWSCMLNFTPHRRREGP